MGAQLVGLAYSFAANHDLTGNEMRVLAWMALHALDADARPRYFMAPESTAYSLGYMVADDPLPTSPSYIEDTKRRDAAFRRVRAAITGLAKKNAIVRLNAPRTGHRAEYGLAFGNVDKFPELLTVRPRNVLQVGTKTVRQSWTENVPIAGRKASAQGTTDDPLENSRSGQHHHPGPSHLASALVGASR